MNPMSRIRVSILRPVGRLCIPLTGGGRLFVPRAAVGRLFIPLAAAAAFAPAATAQFGDTVNGEYPEVAALFNAFDVTQAEAFDAIGTILADPASAGARQELSRHFDMLGEMSMNDMMHGDHGMGMDMGMDMDSPYGDQEAAARLRLLDTLRGSHSAADAAAAIIDSRALDRHTSEVLRVGREFENRLFAIYADDGIADKQAAVAAAVADYLGDERHAVPAVPKDTIFQLTVPEAAAFSTSFPKIKAFLWTQQWLQLAALEAVILQSIDDYVTDGVATALERFWNKIGSEGGMSMFPAPVELPMAPAIAPNLYSQSPEAAAIIDNLNVLKAMVADVLSHPELSDKRERIEDLVAGFTNRADDLADPMDYLLFALRGGIYNQGGPAVGELTQSERNRSPAMMDMQHVMIMSSPQ